MKENFNKRFLLNLVICFCSLANSGAESEGTICTKAKNNFGHTTCAGAPERCFQSKKII